MIAAAALTVERGLAGGGRRRVLQGIDVRLQAGELGLLLGRPGAGKTTLLECLAGLLAPCAGTATVCGPSGEWQWGPGSAPAGNLARGGVGLLFQFPERQIFAASAREDVAWGLPGDGAAQARAALALVELAEDRQLAPLQRLSRGEQRRVALAGVLARDPAVLLLDEPGVGLDVGGRALLWREVERFRAQRGAAVLVATHRAEDLLGAADQVLCLEAGRSIFNGTPAGLVAAARGSGALRRLLPRDLQLLLALEIDPEDVPPTPGWAGQARPWLERRWSRLLGGQGSGS